MLTLQRLKILLLTSVKLVPQWLKDLLLANLKLALLFAFVFLNGYLTYNLILLLLPPLVNEFTLAAVALHLFAIIRYYLLPSRPAQSTD